MLRFCWKAPEHFGFIYCKLVPPSGARGKPPGQSGGGLLGTGPREGKRLLGTGGVVPLHDLRQDIENWYALPNHVYLALDK